MGENVSFSLLAQNYDISWYHHHFASWSITAIRSCLRLSDLFCHGTDPARFQKHLHCNFHGRSDNDDPVKLIWDIWHHPQEEQVCYFVLCDHVVLFCHFHHIGSIHDKIPYLPAYRMF